MVFGTLYNPKHLRAAASQDQVGNMKLIAIFNRDGGTFRTTDMDAYCDHAREVFSRAGHTIDCRVVSGKEVVEEMERAADEPDIEGIIAGGGDGTISAAAGIAGNTASRSVSYRPAP